MPTQRFPGRFESLAAIGEFVKLAAQAAGMDRAATYEVQLAVDEVCANIIEHGYGGEDRGEIVCHCEHDAQALTITVRDWGQTFDPSQAPLPDYDVALDELPSGGAGVAILRKAMDELHYNASRKEGNLLTMVKKI
jgi:anti-sigma regulatory factor (Ser/Thr protein kinase)